MSHTCSYFSRCKHLVISSLPIVAMLIGGVTAALLGDALQVLQRVLQCVAVCCIVLQCVASRCIVLHCVALC